MSLKFFFVINISVCDFYCIFSGFRCWDSEATGVDINDELAQIANKADLGEEGPNGKNAVCRQFCSNFYSPTLGGVAFRFAFVRSSVRKFLILWRRWKNEGIRIIWTQFYWSLAENLVITGYLISRKAG